MTTTMADPGTGGGIDLSKPLGKDEKLTVYVVHRGTFINKETKESGLTDPVCTRSTRDDAQSIADLLNQAQEGVFYLRYVSSNYFPLAKGTGDEVRAKAEDPEVLEQWEKIASPLRKELYLVAELQVVEDADAAKFKKMQQSQ